MRYEKKDGCAFPGWGGATTYRGFIPSSDDRALDAVLLGRIAVDLNPVDYNKPLSESTTFKRYLGGSPANIAVGLARLSRKVSFFGKVSADAFGDFVTNFFINEGIDVSHIVRAAPCASIGLTFTEILSQTQSNILMVREGAADLLLHPSEIDEGTIASARLLLISGTALSRSPSREAALKALSLARSVGTPIVFDADYRPYTWQNDDEIAVYTSWAAEHSAVLLGSRDEFDRMERLCGLDGSDESSARYWHGKGVRIIIIKHGKEGSHAFAQLPGADNIRSLKVLPFPVDAIKGFGGGDGYASALLHGLLDDIPLETALEMASASAAMLVSSHACSLDMPTRDTLAAFISSKKAVCGPRVLEEQ